MGFSFPNSPKLEVLKFQSSHFSVRKAIAPGKLRMSCPRLGNLWWMFKRGLVELNHFFQNAVKKTREYDTFTEQ